MIRAMRTKLARSSLAVLAAAMASLILSTAPSAAGGASVSPKKWASSFCGAVLQFRQDIDGVTKDVLALNEDLSELSSDPSAVFDFIETEASYLDDYAEVSERAAEDIRDLDQPKVGGGPKIKRALNQILAVGFDDLVFEFEAAAADFRSITESTSDPLVAAGQFVTAAEQVSSVLDNVTDTLQAAFDALPDDPSIDPDGTLERALGRAKACKRLQTL